MTLTVQVLTVLLNLDLDVTAELRLIEGRLLLLVSVLRRIIPKLLHLSLFLNFRGEVAHLQRLALHLTAMVTMMESLII